MQEKASFPAIRFAGFTDAWEQRKLGEVGSTYTGLAGKTKEDFGHGSGRFVTYMNVFTNTVSDAAAVEPIEIDNAQNEVKYGDVFFTTSSETPEEVGMSSIWLETSENTYLNSFCFGFRPTERFDPYYLAYMLRSDDIRKKITFLAQGISRYNISKSKMMDIEIPVAKEDEQRLLGAFFRHLDHLITLHQRRYLQLCNFKKSMLEKMFPKEGADVPEIRFAGFRSAWKPYTLGEMSKSFEYGLNAAATTFDGKNKYIRITDIDDETRLFLTSDITSPAVDLNSAENYQLRENDIVFARTGASVGKTYIYKSFDGIMYYAGFLIRARIRPEYCAEFVFQNTLTERYKKFIYITSQRSGQPGVNAQEYSTFEFPVPDYEEQQQISRFFYSLDHLITLHQRKLDRLQNIKKACLEKMFV